MTKSGNKNLSLLASVLEERSGVLHLMGICGVGMAGLALHLAAAGFEVEGCDLQRNVLSDWLEAKGIKVLFGHDPEHIHADVKAVICSSAVPDDDPELVRAREVGSGVFLRGEVLSLMVGSGSVAVGGTHGKTSTTAFIVQLLECAGRKPSWCIGGDCDALTGVAGVGADAVFVAEADESDGTIALYHPDVAVITNIEFDHMEHFDDEEAVKDCFGMFIDNAMRKVIYCADDPCLQEMMQSQAHDDDGLQGLKCSQGRGNGVVACLGVKMDGATGGGGKFLSYGFSDCADVRAILVEEGGSFTKFKLFCCGEDCGEMVLGVSGVHNVLNSLAAVSVGLTLGLQIGEIREGLKCLVLPHRRLERVVEKDGILVVSDYAHHPTEIAVLVRTAKHFDGRRLLAVFQPHRYTRTLALGELFPAAFKGVDELILLPVYAASEQSLVGGNMLDLYSRFRVAQSLGADKTCDCVLTASTLEQCWGYIRHKLIKGDVFLVIGAGDVLKISQWARADFVEHEEDQSVDLFGGALFDDLVGRFPGVKMSKNESLAGKTTLNVGGAADVWMLIDSENDLRDVLMWVTKHDVLFRILGAGSNVLVGDLGVRGVTARLAGKTFSLIEKGAVLNAGADGETVRVGAGMSIAGLLEWCEKHSLTGLEFLEGIPGTVGGALRMNAGALGDEICAHISWIRCLNSDGTECIVNGSELNWAYRSCESLDGKIVVAAELHVKHGLQDVIHSLRESARTRRLWLKGLRSAGSVFKNPEHDVAGVLLDAAGLKGVGVGGAFVSMEHANVIVTQDGVLAADVHALMDTMRMKVMERFDIALESEIVVWE